MANLRNRVDWVTSTRLEKFCCSESFFFISVASFINHGLFTCNKVFKVTTLGLSLRRSPAIACMSLCIPVEAFACPSLSLATSLAGWRAVVTAKWIACREGSLYARQNWKQSDSLYTSLCPRSFIAPQRLPADKPVTKYHCELFLRWWPGWKTAVRQGPPEVSKRDTMLQMHLRMQHLSGPSSWRMCDQHVWTSFQVRYRYFLVLFLPHNTSVWHLSRRFTSCAWFGLSVCWNEAPSVR